MNDGIYEDEFEFEDLEPLNVKLVDSLTTSTESVDDVNVKSFSGEPENIEVKCENIVMTYYGSKKRPYIIESDSEESDKNDDCVYLSQSSSRQFLVSSQTDSSPLTLTSTSSDHQIREGAEFQAEIPNLMTLTAEETATIRRSRAWSPSSVAEGSVSRYLRDAHVQQMEALDVGDIVQYYKPSFSFWCIKNTCEDRQGSGTADLCNGAETTNVPLVSCSASIWTHFYIPEDEALEILLRLKGNTVKALETVLVLFRDRRESGPASWILPLSLAVFSYFKRFNNFLTVSPKTTGLPAMTRATLVKCFYDMARFTDEVIPVEAAEKLLDERYKVKRRTVRSICKLSSAIRFPADGEVVPHKRSAGRAVLGSSEADASATSTAATPAASAVAAVAVKRSVGRLSSNADGDGLHIKRPVGRPVGSGRNSPGLASSLSVGTSSSSMDLSASMPTLSMSPSDLSPLSPDISIEPVVVDLNTFEVLTVSIKAASSDIVKLRPFKCEKNRAFLDAVVKVIDSHASTDSQEETEEDAGINKIFAVLRYFCKLTQVAEIFDVCCQVDNCPILPGDKLLSVDGVNVCNKKISVVGDIFQRAAETANSTGTATIIELLRYSNTKGKAGYESDDLKSKKKPKKQKTIYLSPDAYSVAVAPRQPSPAVDVAHLRVYLYEKCPILAKQSTWAKEFYPANVLQVSDDQASVLIQWEATRSKQWLPLDPAMIQVIEMQDRSSRRRNR